MKHQAEQQNELAKADLPRGVVIRAAREAQGVTLNELARRVGCSPSLVSRIENEIKTNAKPVHRRIAKELGLDSSSTETTPIKMRVNIVIDVPEAQMLAERAEGSGPFLSKLVKDYNEGRLVEAA